MDISAEGQSTLRREDWDFSTVPESEIEDCFLWECLREWPQAISDHDEWYRKMKAGETITPRIDSQIHPLDNYLGIRNCWGLINAMDELKAQVPWIKLPKSLKKNVGMIKDPVAVSLMVIEPEIAPTFLSLSPKHFFLFRIDWRQSDSRICEDFASYVKSLRLHPARERRGGNPRDWLKMIGAMRLLHHYSLAAAVRVSTNVLGAPLYAERPSWERARKGALRAFHEYFFVDYAAFDQPPVPKSYPKYSGPPQLIASTHPDGV